MNDSVQLPIPLHLLNGYLERDELGQWIEYVSDENGEASQIPQEETK